MIINKNKCVQITFTSRVSSNINEVIKTILNLFIFFTRRFYTHKKHEKHANEQKQERQHFYAHKTHLRGRKLLVWRVVLFTLFMLFVPFVLFVVFVLFVFFVFFMLFVIFTLFTVFVLFMFFVLFVVLVRVKSTCKKKNKTFKIVLMTSFILLLTEGTFAKHLV